MGAYSNPGSGLRAPGFGLLASGSGLRGVWAVEGRRLRATGAGRCSSESPRLPGPARLPHLPCLPLLPLPPLPAFLPLPPFC